MDQVFNNALTDLVCSECDSQFDADTLQTWCEVCDAPLLARYDAGYLRERLSREHIQARPAGMWRWAELLPVRQAQYRYTLGEGGTPLLPAPRLGERLNLQHLYIKEESCNPTGSFKARGLAVAVSRGIELGVRAFAIPTAGNAGGALAAYTAHAGGEAHVFMPADAPRLQQAEVQIHGADLRLVPGLIHEAGRIARMEAAENGWFDVSTFREPYRVEGKKTMGFEISQDFAWELPEVILYPTGGGAGLAGMWKAFTELEALGWIDGKRPRMVSVQAAGCAPIVRAFQEGAPRAHLWEGAHTLAAGLRVPQVFADRLILRALRESNGTTVAVSDEEMLEYQRLAGHLEGVFMAPEGAATVAALHRLCEQGWIHPDERVVIFNTAHGLKYL